VWNAVTGRELLSFSVPASNLFDVEWSPDGKRILSSLTIERTTDKSLRIWDVFTGRKLLMPRLKNIYEQKLYRPKAGEPNSYPNLKLILTRPIDWALIKQQYNQMIKYVTAMRLGTAETEAILRRFTRTGPQHPTYQAFLELGRAVKTIFLCKFLESEALRREIHEGFNVIEN
jgi:Tn3 transposase DDE domain